MLAIAATAELDNVGLKVEIKNAILGSIFAKALTGALGGAGRGEGGNLKRIIHIHFLVCFNYKKIYFILRSSVLVLITTTIIATTRETC